MKIIGGKYKGRNFYMPAGIRPTQSMAREAVFDILGQDMEGMSFLDLFAGSGAVGLEAFSRGCRNVTAVEKDLKCASVIRENIALLTKANAHESGAHFDLIETDAFAAVKHFARLGKRFDFIFIDPPFSRGLARQPGKPTGGLAKKALKTLERYDILQPNCVVIIQHEKREILPEALGRFLIFRRKNYGSSVFSIYKTKIES